MPNFMAFFILQMVVLDKPRHFFAYSEHTGLHSKQHIIISEWKGSLTALALM